MTIKLKLLFIALFLSSAISLFAVPAKRGVWKTITLSDGTSVRVELRGDEYGHWWQAENGQRFVQNDSTGKYQSVTDDFVSRAAKRRQVASNKRKAMRRYLISASTADGLGKYGTSGAGAVNTIGEYTFPVIMVQFSDTKLQSTTTVEKMMRYYNEEGYNEETGSIGSVKDYFNAQSYGKFVPSFDVVGIVTLSHRYSYYGRNDSDGSDINVDGMVNDAVEAAISQLGVDFSKYVSGDGVPLVCVLYAGEGEATGGNSNTVWPCEFDCQTTMGGTYFRSYFVGNELYGGSLMGMGVFCHEFGHAAGLPDWYCTDNSYSGNDPFGDWSIMDTGAYVGDSYAPVGYTALERSMLGWLDIPEVSTAVSADSTTVTLDNPNSLGQSAVKITTGSSTENFILENRQPGTWYTNNSGGKEFGSGLMLTRVAYDEDDWNGDVVNVVENMQRCMMVKADGAKLSYYYNVGPSNLYGNGENSITTLNLYNGKEQSVNITSISKNDDGTVSFAYSKSNPSEDDDSTIVVPVDGVLFHETFDNCNGVGGNDGKFSSLSPIEATFSPDNQGWEGNYISGGSKCAWFGSSKNLGDVKTPYISLPGDTVTLSFRAAGWNTSKERATLQISVSGNNAKLVDSSFLTLTKGNFNNYSIRIVGRGSVQIEFTGNRRFFLDDVLVTNNNVTTGIETIKSAKRVKDNRIYNISGQFVGTDINSLPKGLYIINGRKVVR